MCCSAAPWSQGVSHSMTQLLPGTCFGCLPALQQDLGMHHPQQPVPAYPWGATTGAEAVRVPRHVTMLSGQPGSPLEGGDMRKRGIPECRLDIASHCLLSERYCVTKAEIYHTSSSKQLVSEPPKVLLLLLSFFSKNIKGSLANSGHCQARECQILTRSLLARPVCPSRAGWEHLSMGTGDVEELLGADSQYFPLHLQIAWEKATKNICCFCLHIKELEWEADTCGALPQRSQELLPSQWPWAAEGYSGNQLRWLLWLSSLDFIVRFL